MGVNLKKPKLMKNTIATLLAILFVGIIGFQFFELKPWEFLKEDTLLKIFCTTSFFIVMSLAAFIRYIVVSFHNFLKDLLRMQNHSQKTPM